MGSVTSSGSASTRDLGAWARLPSAVALALGFALAGCPKSEPAKGGPSTTSAEASAAASGAASAGSSAPSASAAASAAPPSGAPPKDLNVLLLSIDSLRADMPWAGYPRPIAPRLTELEKKSVSYTRSYAVSSYTSMSLGALLAGRLPSELKRDGFFFGTYAKDAPFFPSILQRAGVKTLSAHAHGYFKSAGFEQGFDTWEIVPGLKWNNTTDENVTGDKHEAIAERLLSDPALATQRFFAWFHFLDPHDQYLTHEQDGIPPFGPSLRDKYDGEVLYTDRQVGKLLDFVAKQPWAGRTAIIVTSDHGEAFGEHKQFAHGFELWENLVRVPLFFVLPGAPPKRIETPRSAIDLAPTIVALLGAPADPGFEGKSLVAELYGAPAEPRDVVCDLPATSDNDKRRAVISGKKKVIAYGNEGFTKSFDLEVDPDENAPLSRGELHEEMTKKVRDISKGVREVVPWACGPGCLNRAYMNKP